MTHHCDILSDIPQDISAHDMSQLFEAELRTGALEVEREGKCFWRKWEITFTGVGGNKPLFQVDASKLIGNNITTTVKETREGGLLRILTGEFLRTPESRTQVRKVVIDKICVYSINWSRKRLHENIN